MNVYEDENLLVQPSQIEGLGLFARRNFKAGERVLEWGTRKKLSREELAEMSEDEIRRYVSHKDGAYLLSGIPMRYVNHSCDPTTRPQHNGDVAVRDIEGGEEITSDYTDFGTEGARCHCGAAACKGAL